MKILAAIAVFIPKTKINININSAIRHIAFLPFFVIASTIFITSFPIGCVQPSPEGRLIFSLKNLKLRLKLFDRFFFISYKRWGVGQVPPGPSPARSLNFRHIY